MTGDRMSGHASGVFTRRRREATLDDDHDLGGCTILQSRQQDGRTKVVHELLYVGVHGQ